MQKKEEINPTLATLCLSLSCGVQVMLNRIKTAISSERCSMRGTRLRLVSSQLDLIGSENISRARGRPYTVIHPETMQAEEQGEEGLCRLTQ